MSPRELDIDPCPHSVSSAAHVGRRLLLSHLTTVAASGPDTTAAAATAKNTNRCSGGAALPSPAPDRRPPWTLETETARPEIVTE